MEPQTSPQYFATRQCRNLSLRLVEAIAQGMRRCTVHLGLSPLPGAFPFAEFQPIFAHQFVGQIATPLVRSQSNLAPSKEAGISRQQVVFRLGVTVILAARYQSLGQNTEALGGKGRDIPYLTHMGLNDLDRRVLMRQDRFSRSFKCQVAFG